MLTELIIIFPIIILTYFKILPIYISCVFLFVVYWLPKIIVINALNSLFPTVLTHTKNKKNQIALTFDDVPYQGTDSLEKIVALLEYYKMKGTFFVISGDVDEHSRKILVRIVKNGHQLGNHGRKNKMHAILSKKNLTNEIIHCDELISSIYDEANVELPSTMLYRPGCGMFHQMMINLCTEHQYTLTLGSVYPNDPIVSSPEINLIYLKYHIEENDIVILHDRKWTSPMLGGLLKYMQQKNMSSVTVQDLLNKKDS